MFNGMTPTQLRDALAAVEPVDLKGLAMLRRRQPRSGRWFPAEVSPRVLAEAAGQMMDYMQDCERAMGHLKNLHPVALAAPVEEFPL